MLTTEIFPEPPKEGEVLNCAEAGVLGVLPGIIGTMMANETIKLITGIGEPLINQLLTYNALNNQVYLLNLSARKETRSLIPQNEQEFLRTDYDWLCAAAVQQEEIDSDTFNAMIAKGSVDVIDVRESHETSVHEFGHIKIPLAQLQRIVTIKSENVIAFCQSGKRSLQAAKILSVFLETQRIYSLRGGIVQWKQDREKLPVKKKTKEHICAGPIAASFIAID
jgi:adenylyltransferase/sulfurtransferase